MSNTGKKILMLIAVPGFSFSNEHSAVAKYLITLKNALEKEGYTVNLCPVPREGTTVTHKPAAASSFRKLLRRFVPYLYNTLADLKYYKAQDALAAEAEKLAAGSDLIVEFLTYGSAIGSRLASLYKKPLLVIFDSPLELQYHEMHPAGSAMIARIEKAERRSVEAADAVICYSNAVKSYIRKQFGREHEITVMPCIVWKGLRPVSSTPKKYIGFVGSFLTWHKVENLVSAFSQIADEFKEVELLLIGYGIEWSRIKQLASSSNYSERILMPGFVSEEQLNEYKDQMIVGVMPGSNWYGSPLKLFEYAESGIPVIAPSTDSVKDLFVKDKEALFIDPSDEVNSLASHLRFILSNEAERRRLSESAFQKMSGEFGKARQTAIFTELTGKLIKRGAEK